MPSLIEGYNYDIFISYRQKDNKGERWVNTFVETLKTELESAFKEEISVYFDINPHDGLLETHDVDESLKEKLKCLVFIPIISRTYCDPKSFAWEHEFKAFVSQASRDQFGLKVRLPNGNVAGRVLPVRIHDLVNEDIKECESILGGVLRGIEFIYKEPGVDKPLVPGDNERKNLNNTTYRIQIVKVANAIREIISGMQTESAVVVRESVHLPDTPGVANNYGTEDIRKRLLGFKAKKNLAIAFSSAILLMVAATLIYSWIFRHERLQNLQPNGKVSVAVMPFQNMTNDTVWNVWQEGIQNELIASLTNSEELKVRQTESTNSLIESKNLTNYASITPAVARNLSEKLEANIFIYGSIKQAGTKVRLNAQLYDINTGNNIKSLQTEGIPDDIFYLVDSLSDQVRNFLIITELKKELSPGTKYLGTTSSPEAFRYFIYGQKAFNNTQMSTAAKWFSQALTLDTTFISAKIGLSYSYFNQAYSDMTFIDKAKELCLELYDEREQMPPELKLNISKLYASLFETPYEVMGCLRQIKEFDDQSPNSYYSSGHNYLKLEQYDKAIPEFEKALEIYKRWGTKPKWIYNYIELGIAYHLTGQYQKEKKIYNRARRDFPDNEILLLRQSVLALTEKNTVSANKYIDKYLSVLKDQSLSEAEIATSLAFIYQDAGIPDKAERYYRQALASEPGNPRRMNGLAWLLINENLNIDEGLMLIDKAIDISPDIFYMLDTKGWGLYKQGQFQKALELINRAWELKPVYDHQIYLHLEAAKKAVALMKNNQ